MGQEGLLLNWLKNQMAKNIRWDVHVFDKLNKQSGGSILETLISLAIISIFYVGFVNSASKISDSYKMIKIRDSVNAVRSKIFESVNCAKTFQDYVNPTTNRIDTCPQEFVLRDSFGNPINKANQKGRPTPNYVGKGWFAKAQCDATKESVVVRIEKRGAKSDKPLEFPFFGEMSYKHPNLNPIIGKTTPYRLCPEYFDIPPRIKFVYANQGAGRFAGINCSMMKVADMVRAGHSACYLECLQDRIYDGGVMTGCKSYQSTAAPDLRLGQIRCTCFR